MKRLLFIITLAGLLVCNYAFSQSEAAETLIDFNEVVKDYSLSDGRQENEATLVYFGDQAGTQATEHLRKDMFSSLAMDNWRVTLASSSRTVERQSLCQAKEVKTKNGIGVMGIRIRFPESAFNSYALIEPPFEIQAFQRKYSSVNTDDGNTGVTEDEADYEGTKFDNKGVLKNVGIIKTISVEVYGANYPHGIGIMIMDENYQERIYHLGYLDYEGWQTLQWENPNYIADVRNRELIKYPLYPRSKPYVKLEGFVIYRDAATIGGDFITYIKDVKVTYDDAVLDTTDEIDHEQQWGILRDRTEMRRKVEYQRLGEKLLLEVIERQKTVDFKEKNSSSSSSTTE